MPTDITGQKYGKLTAIKLYHTTRNGAFWLCQCECGNTCVASEDNLKAGRMTSCRCVRESKRSLIGKKFGKLTVLAKTDERYSDGSILYECLCDCGKTTVVRGDSLKNGNTVSCGCIAEQTLNAGRTKLKKAFFDGTNVRQISPDRKLNSNNKTGVKGVCWSSQKKEIPCTDYFQG